MKEIDTDINLENLHNGKITLSEYLERKRAELDLGKPCILWKETSELDRAKRITPRMRMYCRKHGLDDIPDLDIVWRKSSYHRKNISFWDKVHKCKHVNISPDYLEYISCPTPYCSGSETHCLDCGVYISECGCGSCSGLSGWSQKKWLQKKRIKD